MTLKEIYKALLEGETLSYAPHKKIVTLVRLGEESLIERNIDDTVWYPIQYVFSDLEFWNIYKEPQWYEQDISKGVLCKVRNSPTDVSVVVIVKYSTRISQVYPFIDTRGGKYKNPIPLDLSKPLAEQLYETRS